MYRFWDSVIEPVASAAEARVVVEVGSWRGHLTRALLPWCAARGATAHVIDPRPRYDADDLVARWAPTLTYHRYLSLEALPAIDDPDLVLIDGDHNWFTVYSELCVLDAGAEGRPEGPPIVCLHDIDWPYARRDLYYDPERVPAAERQTYDRLGVLPDRRGLVEGGLNHGLAHARHEGGPRNGVRTAIEDFLEHSAGTWSMTAVTGENGLALLIEERRERASPALGGVRRHLESAAFLRGRCEELEAARIAQQLAALPSATTGPLPTMRRKARARPAVTRPSPDPAVSIVVVVHDTPEELRGLLESIARHTPVAYEVTLVDNGSPDPSTIADVAAPFEVRLVRNEDNLPFSVASNAGVRLAHADEVLLINSDCIVTVNWLENMQTALHSDTAVAAVGPRSNSAHLAQGGVWLDDTSREGIDRFARSFNRPDPSRWFEVDWLVGFTLLARRSALEEVGGFDEAIRTGDGEDRDLSRRLVAAGHRLLCAGDTFVWHFGQRTYSRAKINRTGLRYGMREAHEDGLIEGPGRLLRSPDGRVFEVREGVAHHIETGTVLRLLQGGRPIEDDHAGELSTLPVGNPGHIGRRRGSEEVWVVHAGRRHQVTGDRHRIRRLPGLSILDGPELNRLPAGPELPVESAIPAPPEIRPLVPTGVRPILPERLADVAAVADDVRAAVSADRGHAVISLSCADVVQLNDGAWPLPGEQRADPAAARALRRVLIDADVVGVPLRRDAFACTPLLEQLLFHLDCYPPVLTSAGIGLSLCGFDPESGTRRGPAPLIDSLEGRPVAVVGSPDTPIQTGANLLGLVPALEISLGGPDDLQAAMASLESNRDDIAAVVVAAGLDGKVLCGRAAVELDLPAVEIGAALHRALYPLFGVTTDQAARRRWKVERYLQEYHAPPPQAHAALEGRLLRVSGTAAIFYVERGKARHVTNSALLPELSEQAPIEISSEELADIPRGLPTEAVFAGRLALPIHGELRPLDIGLEIVDLCGTAIEAGDTTTALEWRPG